MNGYLEIVIGPMFSGKTKSLIAIYNSLYKTENVIAINHIIDNRYSENMITSHDKDMIPCIMIDDIYDCWFNEKSEWYKCLHESNFILINEGQFFNRLYSTVIDMLYHEKKVFIYSLDGDYKQDKFGEVLDLIPYCDYIEKRKAICKKCKGHAIFTNRICNDKSQVLVGTNVEYEPLCRSCYKNIQQNDEISLD